MIWERSYFGIWQRTKFCSILHLHIATFDAITNFNAGKKALTMILKKLNIIPGKFMIDGYNSENKILLYHSSYKNQSEVKLR